MTYAHDPAAIGAAVGSSWNLDETAEQAGWAGVALVPRIANNRDAHAYDVSNMAAAVRIMTGQEYREGAGSTDYTDAVAVISLNHWAVGWIEWLAFDAGSAAMRELAEGIASRLDDYPLLDEDDAMRREWADNHPDGTYCYADADAECHPTDDMGRILDPAPDQTAAGL
jgi:hypothetical protein